jgi:apolipoprotein N-acyltransferase
MLPSTKSKVVHGFAELSGLVLMAGAFLMVIGCPYSNVIREAGSSLGGVLVAGLTVYSACQFVTRFKPIFNQARSQAARLARMQGNFIRAVSFFRRQTSAQATRKTQNLRLPPDIFFAKEIGE